MRTKANTYFGSEFVYNWVSLPQVKWDGVVFDEVLTVTDRGTELVHFLATRDTATASQTAQFFHDEVARIHGLPSSIISDWAAIFTSAFWKALMQLYDIDHHFTSPFHPPANVQAERTNQTLLQVLRTMCAERGTRDWLRLLTLAEMAINNAPIANTEYTPYYLTY